MTRSSITPNCRRNSRRPFVSMNASARRIRPSRPSRMDAGRIINIKLGRVGGFAEAKRVHDVAQAAGIPVWCGGMLEAGIGRAHNIALATLPELHASGRCLGQQALLVARYHPAARGSDAARNHRRSRRAGLRLRTRSRISRFHNRPPGIHVLDVGVPSTPEDQPELSLHLVRPGGQRDRRPFQQRRRLQPGAGQHTLRPGGHRASCSRARFPR